jgi:F-type H+-transporting ATPase subunit epsilon
VARAMHVRVVTPASVVFEGTARSLVAPAWDGWVGVLPGHAPFLTLMGDGPMTVETESGSRRSFEIGGGVMKVESNRVTVLADKVPVMLSAKGELPSPQGHAKVSMVGP